MNLQKISLIVLISSILPVQSASGVIRVETKHYEPFMYRDSNGKFVDGVEFHLMEAIAAKLDMKLEFKESSLDLYSPNFNNTDIVIGGLFLDSANLSDQWVASMPYIQDDLTWCIQKARKLPWLFNPFVILSPAVWIITVFGYGYGCGTLLYLLIQFDAKYKKRNQRDWHYTVFMVALPSVIGVGQRFYPQSWKIRIFYACMLVTLIIGVQMCLGYFLTFLRIQSPMYQVNTVKELISYQYTLMGSAQVQQLAWTAEKYTETQRQSFLTCSNISRCLTHLSHFNSIAIGASRQHILNGPAYTSDDIYCFGRNENIAEYRISMMIAKDFEHRYNINQLTQRISQAGLITKWQADHGRSNKNQALGLDSIIYLRFEQLQAIFYAVLPIGFLLSISTFIAELIIQRKLRNPKAARIWTLLEHFFDGKRHYFTNLPERLQRSRDLNGKVI